MEQETRSERQEVYERIPWETLEQSKPDRQWLMFGVGGAIVLGVLAYSFVSDRTPQPVPPATVPVQTAPLVEVPPPSAAQHDEPVPIAALPEPVLVSEADLFAVDPERVVDQAVAHAEWFVLEYFTADGSEEHRAALGSLLPSGIPLPNVPEGTSVFVESVVSTAVDERPNLNFLVEVVVRYLVANNGEAYRRQEPIVASVAIAFSDGGPMVVAPPSLSPVTLGEPSSLILVEVPAEVAAQVKTRGQVMEILGGLVAEDGSWTVIALVRGGDGVTRPVSVPVG